MAVVRISTGTRNALLDTGIDTAFDSGVLEIRSGAQPASANDAPAGTVLATITLPADAFGAVGSGAIAKAGTWEDTSADATETAAHFRLMTSTDGGGSSTTDIRIDGDVTITASGGAMELDNTSIASGQTVTINTFTITMPAS
jgi:hypothetical protein